MAKKSKTRADDNFAEDDAWEDDTNAPDSSTSAHRAGTREGEGSDEEPPVRIEGGYEVLDPGTIIDGIYYPRSKCAQGQEMTADLDAAQAQELVNNGVRLSKDGEELAAEKNEEPTIEDQAEAKL